MKYVIRTVGYRYDLIPVEYQLESFPYTVYRKHIVRRIPIKRKVKIKPAPPTIMKPITKFTPEVYETADKIANDLLANGYREIPTVNQYSAIKEAVGRVVLEESDPERYRQLLITTSFRLPHKRKLLRLRRSRNKQL